MPSHKIPRYCRHLMPGVKRKHTLETGFSMLEAVVVVGVLLALAVGGFFAYGPITHNAKMAKAKSIASQAYTAAMVAQYDNDPSTSPATTIEDFNSNNSEIELEILKANPAVPAMSTVGYIPADGEDFCIQATNRKNTSIKAKSGKCEDAVAVSAGEPPAEVVPEPAQPVDNSRPHVDLLKNGDFNEKLTYWESASTGAMPTVSTAGVASINPGTSKTASLSQAISIPVDGNTHVGYAYSVPYHNSSGALTTFTIKAYDSSGVLLKDIKQHTMGIPALPTTYGTADLSEFAGKNIKLMFHVSANGNAGRPLYLDDVSVQNTTTVPSAPTDVNISIYDTDATVTWKKPVFSSNSVTQYTINPYRNGVELPALTTTGEAPATSTVFKGLTSGGTYTFKITASNKFGASIQSASNVPHDRVVQTYQNGDFSAGLTNWYSLSTGVMPTVSTDGVASINPGTNKNASLSQTISVPTNGNTHVGYSYSVPYHNSSGALTTFTVKAYDPAGNFLKDIKQYTMGIPAVPMTPSTADLTEFAGKDIKLVFHVSANSNAGRPLYLDETSVETSTTVTTAPTDVTVTVYDNDATVSWKKPGLNANSVTQYMVTPYRNGVELPVLTTIGEAPATSTVFKGLTSGGEYIFKVAAVNKFGTSTQSAPSAPLNRAVQVWQNGDFSAGLNNWYAMSTGVMPSVSMGAANINPGTSKNASLSQTVTVPSTGVTKVKYSYSVPAHNSSGALTTFTVNAYDTSGNLLKEIKKYSLGTAAVGTTLDTADLTEFAGKDIKIMFHVAANANAGRPLYLDDTSIETQ